MATKPVQMRIPPAVLERIDAAAATAGLSRTLWVIEACEARLAGAETPRPVPPSVQTSGDACRHPVNRRLGEHLWSVWRKGRKTPLTATGVKATREVAQRANLARRAG